MQGGGFYDPNMPGPNFGQGFKELFQNMLQMEMYKKEQAQKQQQEQLKQQQWEKEYKLEKQRADAYTKSMEPKPAKPTTRDDRIKYAATQTDWPVDKILKFIATGKEDEKPLTLTKPMMQHAVKVMGYTPGQLKSLTDADRSKIYGSWDEFTKPKSVSEGKPPISQPGLITGIQSEAKRKISKIAKQSAPKGMHVPIDADTDWLLSFTKESTGVVPMEALVANEIINAATKIKVILSDREMTSEEKKGAQKLMTILANLEKDIPGILAMEPSATAEEILEYLLTRRY
jgi:hypothetical protein